MKDFIALITRPEVQRFIAEKENADVQDLVLRHQEILGLPSAWIATQIQGRRKAKEKLPLWYGTRNVIYPPAVNLEQCSSEATARYKQGLIDGHHVADLTGGFGVDTWFLSRVFTRVDYVEPDAQLLAIARHNHVMLGADNIRYHVQTASDFLESNGEAFDLIYADPSRRQGPRKVIRLADCAPDVCALQGVWLSRARQVLIKASPLLDLKQVSRELSHIDQFIVLAVDNECRELLLMLRRNSRESEPTIHAVNLSRDGEPTTFAFTWTQEKLARCESGEPQGYLYEPNAAILKAGAFKLIAKPYGLVKLSSATHLYTSDEKFDMFPGRIFRVIEQVSLDKKLRDRFEGNRVNLLVRNYPLRVEEILKKTGLVEGGDAYLIFTRTRKPLVLLARRIR